MHQSRHIGESPPGLKARVRTVKHLGALAVVTVCGTMLGGCKASMQEVRGKTAFGPEFRNRGNNTSEVRYDARQNVDVKWDNGWSTGLTYRRRDVDDGSGDSENLFLFDVGYPLWKAPKKADKTSERIEELERQVEDMKARVAALTGSAPEARVVQADEPRAQTTGQ